MAFSDYIYQHNYYQMPFLLLVCVSSAYAVGSISENVTVRNLESEDYGEFAGAVSHRVKNQAEPRLHVEFSGYGAVEYIAESTQEAKA